MAFRAHLYGLAVQECQSAVWKNRIKFNVFALHELNIRFSKLGISMDTQFAGYSIQYEMRLETIQYGTTSVNLKSEWQTEKKILARIYTYFCLIYELYKSSLHLCFFLSVSIPWACILKGQRQSIWKRWFCFETFFFFKFDVIIWSTFFCVRLWFIPSIWLAMLRHNHIKHKFFLLFFRLPLDMK